MIRETKKALRITSDAFNDEIQLLLESAKEDLKTSGIQNEDLERTIEEISSPLIIHAMITYVRFNFGSPDDYERLKESYEQQKTKLMMTSGYTKWSEKNG